MESAANDLGAGSTTIMSQRPDFIAHWSTLENAEPFHYDNDSEPMGLDASLGRKLGLTRIGIHHVGILGTG